MMHVRYKFCQLDEMSEREIYKGKKRVKVAGKLTAKNVPGRNIIVTSAIDLICLESR